MSVIILGSNHASTAEYYNTLGLPPSQLVTSKDHGHDIGHTGVQDIVDLYTLEKILSDADQVYWAHPHIDEFSNAQSYYDFLDWLKDYNLAYRNVQNMDSITFDPYHWNQSFKLEQHHAVFLGCSFTAGVGLPDPSTHYASQVAQHFDKKLLNLAVPGGNNNLMFDRFTQLDFYPEQLVVVQFTDLARIHYCDERRKLLPLLFSTSQIDGTLHRSLLEVYHKDFLFYELVVKIRAMVAIANAKQLKLVFWLSDYKNQKLYSQLDQSYFYSMKQFVPASWIKNYMVDVAHDMLHPGIESNKNIAIALINYIETVYKDQ
jgi:hypothetical protein